MIKIYNSLHKKKEEFIPITPGKVLIYVCGPTVYDLIHIGNARPMIVFDTVRRYFEYKGYEVSFVSNFTDIDDKIINRAISEGVSAEKISQKYIGECLKDMEGMNVRKANHHPLATNEVEGMIELISSLIEKGYAYEKNGSVYYRVSKFAEYGKLSHKKLDDLRSGNRKISVTGENEKESSLDFVLWKPMKEGEPYWDSPFGKGRPGWHTECCVMSAKYLAPHIDIHAGGEDLIFPHHENEIAQAEAINGSPFANYWMHNAFLKINNEKMSKSLNNFFTVRDIESKYSLNVLRFFMLSAHYRTPLNFSDELMEASKNGYNRIKTSLESLDFKIKNTDNKTQSDINVNEILEKTKTDFESAMDDDFNTSDAISSIFDLVKSINVGIEEFNIEELIKLKECLLKYLDVLGIRFDKEEEIDDSEILSLIDERNKARKNKDFKRADEIRDELKSRNIILEDTRDGVKWKRI